MKRMKLNIQRFADEQVEETTETPIEEKQEVAEVRPTLKELLQNNPDYQSEFDKLNAKSLETAKGKWEEEYQAKVSEAEKLAKMNAEQKLKYELEKSNKERDELKAKLEAGNLYKTATDIANDKGLPIGYLGLIDFSKENAETITNKIDSLVDLRNKDLEGYLNSKLQQPTPQEKHESQPIIDPYIEGFKAEYK